MVQKAIINAAKEKLNDPLTLVGWGATEVSFNNQVLTEIPKTNILQRLDTGTEWKYISRDECQKLKLDESVKPHKGDFCIHASAPGVKKTAGDSGGPLYLTSEKPKQPSFGELVMIS